MASDTRPIIIKKVKKVSGGGHHGGAWKVAYADFVTAMMAFFLLLWLLNATTEKQRKGLADYFNPTIPISRISGGGSDGLKGSSIFTEEALHKMGSGSTSRDSGGSPGDDTDTKKALSEAMEGLKEGLEKGLADIAAGQDGELAEHLNVRLSPEGIILELIDSDNNSLFNVGASSPRPLLRKLLEITSEAFTEFTNDIKIVGHTDALQFIGSGNQDNWSLSAARASTARRILIDQGFDGARIKEVAGKADTDLLIKDNPLAAQNRRVSIVILTDF